MVAGGSRISVQSSLQSVAARADLIGHCGSDPRLPDDGVADARLAYCGVSPDDREEVLASRPDRHRHPVLWWLLSGFVDELRVTLDQPLPAGGFAAWPPFPPASDAVARHLYLWALLTAVEPVRQMHQRRAVPQSVTKASLSLAADLTEHRQTTGASGLAYFALWSPPVRFRGADYALGRHDFTRATAALGDGPAGSVVLVHVPPDGPLDPEASERSFAAAAEFFPRHYPEEPLAGYVCVSWLLDPQLSEYLPATANIVRFQRRFAVLPHVPTADPYEGDREMMTLGLQIMAAPGPITPADLDRIPQDTSLQRAFVSHLRSGRHWHQRTGLILAPTPRASAAGSVSDVP